jgi:hypothetical protein
MSVATAEISETAILSRIVCPEGRPLGREAAEWILQIRFPAHDLARVHALKEKAKEGMLTAEEDRELEHYLHVGRLLELMKSKARQRLVELAGTIPV